VAVLGADCSSHTGDIYDNSHNNPEKQPAPQKKKARRGGPLKDGCPNTLTFPFKEIQISAAQKKY